MALTITDRKIIGTDTQHTATAWPVDVPGEPTLWTVTWLPGRNLTQSQAVSAMMIAEAAGRGVGLSDDPIWKHLAGWAAEIGMGAPAAVVRASELPEGES